MGEIFRQNFEENVETFRVTTYLGIIRNFRQ